MSKEKELDNEKENNGSQHNLITIRIRFQENIVPIEINIHESISALLQHAINATDNQNYPKDRFLLKKDGLVLDTNKKVIDYSLSNGDMLQLTLIAASGG